MDKPYKRITLRLNDKQYSLYKEFVEEVKKAHYGNKYGQINTEIFNALRSYLEDRKKIKGFSNSQKTLKKIVFSEFSDNIRLRLGSESIDNIEEGFGCNLDKLDRVIREELINASEPTVKSHLKNFIEFNKYKVVKGSKGERLFWKLNEDGINRYLGKETSIEQKTKKSLEIMEDNAKEDEKVLNFLSGLDTHGEDLENKK
jgi:hypothetical protein